MVPTTQVWLLKLTVDSSALFVTSTRLSTPCTLTSEWTIIGMWGVRVHMFGVCICVGVHMCGCAYVGCVHMCGCACACGVYVAYVWVYVCICVGYAYVGVRGVQCACETTCSFTRKWHCFSMM